MQLPMSHTQVVFILLLLYFSTTTSSSSSHHKQHRLSQGAVPKRLSLSSSLLKANNHTISAATRTERAPPTSFIQFESQQTVDVQDLQKSASQAARCPAPTRIRVHQESMNKRIGLTKDRVRRQHVPPTPSSMHM